MTRPAFSRISSAVLTALAALVLAVGAVHGQAPAGSAAAKKIKNPVPSTPASVAAGKATFESFCALCHGQDAKGNGPLAPAGSNPPSLVDETWVHGSTDGEIFEMISNGPVPPIKTMPPFKGVIQDTDIWNVINYMRSLGPKTAVR
jgi:mono/diheme cytochrome c family protein